MTVPVGRGIVYTYIHMRVYMTRTNIDIDDALIARVMKRYRLATKKDAVEFALRAVVGSRMSRKEALAMEGSGWESELSDLRDREPPDEP